MTIKTVSVLAYMHTHAHMYACVIK